MRTQKKGFTLLEILLVIAAIGILASIVLVAINPNRQLAQVRNAERRSEINTIYKALEQYLIDKGSYPAGITTAIQDICNTGSQKSTDTLSPTTLCDNKTDLRVLVPDYIAAIPIDPGGGAYKVGINAVNNRVSVYAINAELGSTIAINNGLWTPAQLSGLVLWLDASDSSTITLNGSTVSQWNDKSGNNRHASQSTPENQPTRTMNGLNGRTVVAFDGVNDTLTLSGAFNLGETAVSIASRSSINQPVMEGTISGFRGFWGNVYSGFTTHLNYGVNGAALTAGPPNSAGTNPAIVSQTGYQTELTTWRIGVGVPAYSPLNGYVAEIITTSILLSTTERQRVEGYLAWKWGLVANLPASHPYKNVVP